MISSSIKGGGGGEGDEALPGVWGNRGIRPFISDEQGNKSLKLKGTENKGNFGEQGT